MASGWPPRTDCLTSSNEDTMAVSNRACSSAAFTRTACSRSSVVIRTRSAMARYPAQQIHGMIEELAEYGQSFLHSVRRAREIDDQSLPACPGTAARQPRAGEAGSRSGAKSLGDAFGFALEHGGRGFGGDVARGEAGAAGREHHVHFARVGPARELARDPVGLVGHDTAHHDLVAPLGGPVEDGVARRVGALAYGSEIVEIGSAHV